MFVPSLSWHNDLFDMQSKTSTVVLPWLFIQLAIVGCCAKHEGSTSSPPRNKSGSVKICPISRRNAARNVYVAFAVGSSTWPNSPALVPCGKHVFLSAFPYVCPEPVLVNRSFLHWNGRKKAFSAPGTRLAAQAHRASVHAPAGPTPAPPGRHAALRTAQSHALPPRSTQLRDGRRPALPSPERAAIRMKSSANH
jgi:hypothetical protein